MAKPLLRHYFDASALLAWLKKEEVVGDLRWWHCEQLLEQAQRGESIIFISGVTFAEVTGGKGKSRGIHLTTGYEDVKEVVRAFFENDYIEVVEVGRVVGEFAQQLIWDFSTLDPIDAIHLASALVAGCDVLFTYDGDLLKLVGLTDRFHVDRTVETRFSPAVSSIRIVRPHWDGAIQKPLLDS